MSRPKVKKFLQSLTEEQLVEVLLDLYDARKDAKEYLEFYINPDTESAHEKARKSVLQNYFNNKGKTIKKLDIRSGREIVDNFISLGVDSDHKADISMYHVEILISWLVIRRSINQTAWTTLINLSRKAFERIITGGLSDSYRKRVDKYLDYARYAPEHLRVYERLLQEWEESESNVLK